LKKEVGWRMYIKIKELLELGLNKSQIARYLGISRPTLYKYINMTPDEFEEKLKEMKTRQKKPDKYHDEILSWLKEFPDSSGAQIYDWLEEKYNQLDFAESTLRNYIRNLRNEHNIPKNQATRTYEAIKDPPMGKQMQVDFGEKWVFKPDKTKIKLYVISFILSHSRQKYCEWLDRPFTTSDVIRFHENAFEFYGGMPEEIVYDQDHLILASENHGDLIYTHEFAAYHQKRKFRTYICRKNDPESKGKIENMIGYVKGNFAHNRTFYNLDRWNEDCKAWLKRRGNGKIHGTTKKIPAQVFKEERKYLRPVLEKIKSKTTTLSITYQVRKDNTIPIKGNRYSVPLGTYQGPNTYVRVFKVNNEYVIKHPEKDEEIARHKIAYGKGKLVKNSNHCRNNSSKISVLISEVISTFPEGETATYFIKQIYKDKPRYIRDQLLLIQESIAQQNEKVIIKALDFCLKNKLFSAVDFRDAINYFEGKNITKTLKTNEQEIVSLSPGSKDKIKTKPQVRDISEYSKLFQ